MSDQLADRQLADMYQFSPVMAAAGQGRLGEQQADCQLLESTALEGCCGAC